LRGARPNTGSVLLIGFYVLVLFLYDLDIGHMWQKLVSSLVNFLTPHVNHSSFDFKSHN